MGTRRGILAAAGAAALPVALPAGLSTVEGRWHGPSGSSGVTLRWLGNNAWEVSFRNTRILVDPWLIRFPTGTYTPSGTRPSRFVVLDHLGRFTP